MLAFAAVTLLVTACAGGDTPVEVRLAWRPDSLEVPTQADSCIQRYFLQGNRLRSDVWCPPYAVTYLQANSQIEVILSRAERRRIAALAEQVAGDRPALGLGVCKLQPGEALVWCRSGQSLNGFVSDMAPGSSAFLLHQEISNTLENRRKSANR
jgi:hypothetical protein